MTRFPRKISEEVIEMQNGSVWKIILSAFLVLFIAGCSSHSNYSDPITPGSTIPTSFQPNAAQAVQTGHNLWAYSEISIDPITLSSTITPIRDAAAHFNILAFLEQSPCNDCLKISMITLTPDGDLLVEITVEHPFDTQNLTGFDVRGIVMLAGSHNFPEADLSTPNEAAGDGCLLNADGFTSLYNQSTEGSGPGGLEGYIKGKFAFNDIGADATLNGYKRFISIVAGNTRNAFLSGDTVSAEFEIAKPDGLFIFGYAMDACWDTPIEKPVDDPMTDFGPDANCAEPWNIDVTAVPIGDGMTGDGGSVVLTIDVYDWQGSDSHADPVVECPELFTGTLSTVWTEDFPEFSRYTTVVENSNPAAPGIYKTLVSVEDNENATSDWWLDLTAYQIIYLEVYGPPVALATADTFNQAVDYPVNFSDDGSYDPDGGDLVNYEWDWENDGVFDDSGTDVQHTWDTTGTYYVQFRVTDDEGETDVLDVPLEITIVEEGIPDNPVDVSPPYFGFAPQDVAVDGNFAFVACGDHGFQVFDMSVPSNPERVAVVDISGFVDSVFVNNGYAYAVSNSAGIHLVDVTPPADAYVVTTYPQDYGLEYLAFDGDLMYATGYTTVKVYDITDPTDPSVLGSTELDAFNSTKGIAARAGYAYVAQDYAGCIIVDADPPSEIHEVAAISDFMSNADDVAVVENHLLIADYNLGLMVVDITNPENTVVSQYVDGTDNISLIDVSNGYAYVHSPIGTRLLAVDIDPIGSAYVAGDYDLDAIAYGLDVSDNRAYVTNGNSLEVIDVSNPASMNDIGEILPPPTPAGVAYSDGYVFAATDYGVIVYAVEPYTDIQAVHTIEPSLCFNSIDIEGNYAYAVDDTDFLHVIDISTPTSASVINTIELPNNFHCRLVAQDGYVYAVIRETSTPIPTGSLQIINVDPPMSAYVVRAVDLDGAGANLAVIDGYAFAAVKKDYSDYSLTVLDVDPPSSASIVHRIEQEFGYNAVAAKDQYVYAFNGRSTIGLQVFNISNPELPDLVHSLNGFGNAAIISGNFLYAGGSSILNIYDIHVPESTETFNQFHMADGVMISDIDVVGNMAYIAGGSGGFGVVKLW